MNEWLSFLGGWLAFLTGVAVVPVATIAVFEGARRFSLKRPLSKATVYLALGIVVLGSYAGGLFWATSGSERFFKLEEERERRPIPVIPEAALAKMTPAEREEKTRLVARMTFDQTGRLVTYSNANGEQVLYAPSEKEIRDRGDMRESLILARTRIEYVRAQVWVMMGALAVAIGLGMSARSREARRGG